MLEKKNDQEYCSSLIQKLRNGLNLNTTTAATLLPRVRK